MASISKDQGKFRVKIRKQGHAPISRNFTLLKAAKQWARAEIESWRNHYKHVRPHSCSGKKPPAVFAHDAHEAA